MKMNRLLHNIRYSFKLTLLLIEVLVLLIVIVHCQLPNDISTSWMEERLFARARCKANCLRLFNNPEESKAFRRTWNNEKFNDLDWSTCFANSHERCSSDCFRTCDLPPTECLSHCSDKIIGCQIGCFLIEQTCENQPGECSNSNYLMNDLNRTPSINQNNQTQYNGRKYPVVNDCANNCQLDCKVPLQTCCKYKCPQLSTDSIYNKLVPPRPILLNSIVSSTNANIIKLSWSSQYQNITSTMNPIVFILQIRICICQVFDESYASTWKTLIMTHEFGANLEAFEPGRLYQFRIAAVSIYGTRGFGLGTNAYPRDPIRPSPPGPPRNVTDSMWRLYSSGKVNLLLKWQPPVQSDLPLTEYLITWSIDHGYLHTDGRTLEALIQFTRTINAERTECILDNLKPATSYKIQVKATSYWHGFGNLESQPNTIFLSTQSIHPAFHQQIVSPVQIYATPNTIKLPKEFTLKSKSSDCDCGNGPQPLVLKKIFYENHKLKAILQINMTIKTESTALIQWYLQVCVDSNNPILDTLPSTILLKSKDKIVILENLHFNCHYGVRVRVYPATLDAKYITMMESLVHVQNQQFDGIVYIGCFCTPSCSNVINKEGQLPDNCILPDLGSPSPPTKVQVIHIDSLNYRISWIKPMTTMDKVTRDVDKHSSLSSSVNKINGNSTKYRVMWAPRIHEPVDESMYNDEIGFSPIMDLRQIDIKVIDQDQTWIVLNQLKPNTLYIVHVQPLFISYNGMQRESDPVSVYFTTICDKQMKSSYSGKYRSRNFASPCPAAVFTHAQFFIIFSLLGIYFL
uniref:Putative anosmin n=1 Tax=Schistosoma mansoni TaxID=6183 RepID=A0A5K4F5H1_SCHMA